jgi:precorrin isomerase
MTCAARRAMGETADAFEHYREVEREGHIRRSHRRRSLPELNIVARCVLAPDRRKTSVYTVASAVTVTRMWKALTTACFIVVDP